MSDIRFSNEHEWIRRDGDEYVVGITRYAADSLGDVVFVDYGETLPGCSLDKDEECAVVESVKAASDIYCPVAGTIVCVNTDLIDDSSIVNEDPEGDGWMFVIKEVDEDQWNSLMTREQYDEFIKE